MAVLVGLGPAPQPDPVALHEKEQKLFKILGGMGRVIVAYSGGTDSAYLAWAAHHVLGDAAAAVTADSASIPESHKRDAEDLARQFGFRHEYIQTREFENPDYVANNPDRCFHCKDELYGVLGAIAQRAGSATVVDGTNADDAGDWRPGRRAAAVVPRRAAA